MEKELQKIANTLLLYSYHIEKPGLLNGKMGIVLYLYQYARYTDCKYYSEFADELLDKVLDSINHSSSDFESGISGIGWGVSYLIKNEYIEGDSNDVLFNVDKRIFSQVSCNPITSVFGQGVYLLERLKDNKSNKELEKHINQLLDFCNKGISEYKGPTTLYHLNSIIYFLIGIDCIESYSKNTEQIKNLIPEILKKIFENKSYDKVDIYIFDRLLSKLNPQQQKQWKDILKSDEVITNFDIESIIKLSFLEYLYFGDNSIKQISSTNVHTFVNLKQESLEKDDFFFCKGLAGLGNAILTMKY